MHGSERTTENTMRFREIFTRTFWRQVWAGYKAAAEFDRTH